MPFETALTRNIDAMGAPTKKQKLEANTPLKFFLRPIIEEAMMRRKQMMQNQQPPQLPDTVGGMVEPSSINSLQNALMSAPQQGGVMSSSQGMGGMPHGNSRTNTPAI
jgi:hypothetical protein